MKKLTNVNSIKNTYAKRILSNVIDKNPLKIFAKTPHDLKRLTDGLSRKQLWTPRGKGMWSIAQIVSHLCDAEIALSYRLRMAIAQSGSALQAYDQDTWAAALYYEKADCMQQVNLFSVLRVANASLLKHLSPKEWQHYGMHQERGKETVERMVQMLAGHDINHLRQIKTIRKNLLAKHR